MDANRVRGAAPVPDHATLPPASEAETCIGSQSSKRDAAGQTHLPRKARLCEGPRGMRR